MADEIDDAELVSQAEHRIIEMFQALRRVEASLKLPKGFLLELSREDDWTCVIKMLAVMEAALEEVLVERCFSHHPTLPGRDDAALAKFVGGMTFSGRTSKLALARAFDLISTVHYEFLVTLAEIRNRYAHRPSNFTKSIRSMLGDGPEGKAKLLKLTLEEMTASSEEQFDAGLKASMGLTACGVLWALHFRTPPPPELGAFNALGLARTI